MKYTLAMFGTWPQKWLPMYKLEQCKYDAKYKMKFFIRGRATFLQDLTNKIEVKFS